MSESRAAYQKLYMQRYRAKKAVGGLLPFQKRFVDALTRKQGAPDIGILCTPRAQGKSWLCGKLIGRSLTPGDVLHEDSVENVLVASSRSQASITLEFARQALSDVPGIRWSNDGAIHVESRARIKIISSDARRSLGTWGTRKVAVLRRAKRLVSPRRGVDSSTLCAPLLVKGSVRSCCVGRLHHLRRKGLALGGLTWWRLVAALAYTSNFCRRMKQSGGNGTNVYVSIRLTW